MPVVQPQNWPYNPWIFTKGEELWNKLPSDVRSNLKFMSDAPTPGLPIGATDDIIAGGMKGAVAIPAMLANPKTRVYLKNMLGGLDLGEAVKAIRNQQENFPFAFTQWIKNRLPRGGLFFSPEGHKFGYDEMVEGAAEGGPHRVEWLQKLKNPLVIKRDETGFLAEHVLRTLLGSESVKQGNKYISVPNEEGKEVLRAIHALTARANPEANTAASKVISKYIEPKQLESSLAARDPKTALGEAIASELARKAGYDSIISTRPKTVISASQKMANQAKIDRLDKYVSEALENKYNEYKIGGSTTFNDLSTIRSALVEGATNKSQPGVRTLEKIRKRTGLSERALISELWERMDKLYNKDPFPEAEVLSNKFTQLANKITRRGAKTELLPTQVMMIEKQFLKDMREKGKQYLNPPRSTLSSYGQSIVNLFKKGQMQSDALPDVIKFNLEQGTITPEEIQLIQQAIQ